MFSNFNTLDDYYKYNKMKMEGFTQQIPKQVKFLKDIVQKKSVINILEIGFNGGHSSELFLQCNNNTNVVSFDIGYWKSVNMGKKFLDVKYPNRHTLILGNSMDTIPEYIKHTHKKFDLIFIDGGHDYEVCNSDLINCKKLAHNDTVVILDDTRNYGTVCSWNIGPNKCWKEVKENKFIIELGSEDYSFRDNGAHNAGIGRGQSWGKYVFDTDI